MVELGVFLPVGKNGYIVSSDAYAQAAPSEVSASASLDVALSRLA
jgi:hypothetical protein